MDPRLLDILESLLHNIATLNSEVMRMYRSDIFNPTAQCFQLLERIRGQATCSMQNIHTVERGLYLRKDREEKPPPAPIDFRETL